MRIAIIGAGISGNLIARLLAGDHDIHVFEANSHVGGHTQSVEVPAFGGKHLVDLGFMVFNEKTYPNFCQLLRILNVPSDDTDMSFSVRCARSGMEYQGSSLDGIYAQRRNFFRPRFQKMMLDILRFHRACPELLETDLGDRTLGDVLQQRNFRGWFIDKYLIPMASAIWSCPPGQLLDFPAHFLLAFLHNHGMVQVFDRPQWKTVRGSGRAYVEPLTAPFRNRIRRNCPVHSVRRLDDGVIINAGGMQEHFDAVVFATHADQTLKMLDDADHLESEVLGCFPYQRNTAVLHTDTSLLPARRKAWASWNYHIPNQEGLPVVVTYDLSRLQHLNTPAPILLTLNGDERIDESKVIERYVFHHPTFNGKSQAAQRRFAEINGRRHSYFCGAYWGYGFHEDGVNSALAVGKYFGKDLNTWDSASTRALSTTSAFSR